MKFLIISTILSSAFFAQAVNADVLLCASNKNESLYFTTGQIRVTAEIASSDLLTDISISTTGSDKLGARAEEVYGKTTGTYTRFEIGGDAWCSYRLVLPKGFMTRERTAAYVDAYCEENANANIRLNCAIQ